MKELNQFFSPKKVNNPIIEASLIEYSFVITYYEQIFEKLKLVTNTTNNDECNYIIYEIKKYLKYNDVLKLIEEIKNDSKYYKFRQLLEKEKYYWNPINEKEYNNQIEEANKSLCTSDFIAYIIGQKVKLNDFEKNTYFDDFFKNLDKNLNLHIIQNNSINIIETDKKAHIPVNYALSMFFHYEKKEALTRFKRLLKQDKTHRLEPLHQAEYLIIFDNFFKRLNIDFIPKIDFNNYNKPVELNNSEKKYITKAEIKQIIDKEDYFNSKGFSVDIKFLLKQDNISNKEWFKELYLIFFQYYCKTVTEKDIEVLFDCFTEINQKFENYEINSVKLKLNQIISKSNISNEFIYFNYYVICYILIDAQQRLLVLIYSFFCKQKNLSKQKIQNEFSDRKDKGLDYTEILPLNLVKHIEELKIKYNKIR